MSGPLSGVRVLDLSRVLAGPSCTQLFGDLGATVLKIENPLTDGDDTRQWGPPYIGDAEDGLSAYFLSANRNKLSLSIDLKTEEGQKKIKSLAEQAHILVENFKPGGLCPFGLDYNSLQAVAPRLVYCSISGFGHSGPNKDKPGYDLMAQGYGGIMSLTGTADGPPMKVGVAVADVVAGLYAATGVLAALRHAEATGQGQHIDLALVDTQIAWTINQGCNYLHSGRLPQRQGNDHPNIVPYGVYECCDGHVIIAVGNDAQFRRFCTAFGFEALAQNPRFATNPNRVAHRKDLSAIINPVIQACTMEDVLARLEAQSVPVGPVHGLDQVFATDQVAARAMQIDLPSSAGIQKLIGNPLKFSKTPVDYRIGAQTCGAQNTLCQAQDIWAASEAYLKMQEN